ncbi:hypothetical protein [Hellea balneolensis]|uniref:hypothetical protein n=1 Tax=Hellea balneolensis TaxID=287478 RepID=UPI0004005474|nr:hypothetical protein [Hellea balneolensis]
MAQKFFGTIFRYQKNNISGRKLKINNFTPIKPAEDIADFEYPAESSFYKKTHKTIENG